MPPSLCPVRLIKKLSMAACVLGSSFGCYEGDARHFWVDHGCRGWFYCDAAGRTAPAQCGSRFDAHRKIKCSCPEVGTTGRNYGSA
jgi:hypothetical protein